ncbi:MAG TPA: glycosyltransferase family 4 protein [Solirubrobacteraceae bacterium]|jgi:glycosyltransferase involved in cell wall biosynthesis|nr:glycosyltransferase family 4 protein [Solirubrobacteraceae bacterium]
MHIALVNHHVGGKAGGGGGVRLMLELGSGLVRRGHRVTIACHDFLAGSEFSYAADELEIRSVRRGAFELPAGNVELARRFWLDMPKVARLVPDDANIVNAHDWLGLRPARIAAGRLSLPLVWTRNNEALWERAVVPQMTITGARSPLSRAILAATTWPDLLDARRASAIAVLSAQQADMVRRSYRKGSLIVPVGPPAHFFDPPDRAAARARLGIADDVFLVVGMGTLVEHRRFEDLIDAMSLLADDPSIHALIAGSDHEDPACADRLAAQIAARDLAARVTMPRASLSDAELKDTYAAADVFVILSQRYAWGLAPLEAIASGTPVILTPGAGVYDVLAGRPGVQAVPVEDPRATADAIRRWRSGEGRDGLESTRAWLRQDFALDSYVARMEQIYESVAGTNRREQAGAR